MLHGGGFFVCFFFQAEDGIRVFCLSRGLGDVYKRQKKTLKLYTHELNIYSELDVVTSQKAVKMIQEPNIEIDGVGMKYDNKDGILKLLSNVKVRYEKPTGDERFKY